MDGTPVTSEASVRITYETVNIKRTDFAHCTKIEHLGTITRVPVSAYDVVKRYLQNLMDTGRVPKKVRLAEAMKTSRTQVYTALREGRITIDHIEALAQYLHSTPSAVLGELAGLAKKMDEELAAEEQTDPPQLPGRVDREKFLSEDRRAPRGGEESSEPGEPSLPSPRRRRPGGQSPRPRR